MFQNQQVLKRYLSLGCAVAMLALSTHLFAGKGGNGGRPGDGDVETPPLTGVVYYEADGGYVASTADGSDSTFLPLNQTAVPSRRLHGGAPWFLYFDTIAGAVDPEGHPRFEMFASRGDGTATVQLTNQANLQIPGNDIDEPWLADDRLITFLAIGRDPVTTEPLTAGVYLAELDFDESGNILGLTAQPNPLEPILELPIRSYPNGFLLVGGAASWAPDLTAIAWTQGDGNLYVRDFLTDPPSGTIIASDSIGKLAWSPDGTRIAFNNGGDIDSIRLDGSDWFIVDRAQQSESLSAPHWSHDGSHLMYLVFESTKKPGPNQLTISNWSIATHASNGGDRNILDEAGFIPRAWRE